MPVDLNASRIPPGLFERSNLLQVFLGSLGYFCCFWAPFWSLGAHYLSPGTSLFRARWFSATCSKPNVNCPMSGTSLGAFFRVFWKVQQWSKFMFFWNLVFWLEKLDFLRIVRSPTRNDYFWRARVDLGDPRNPLKPQQSMKRHHRNGWTNGGRTNKQKQNK